MPTDQYHEPPVELSDDIRTFARLIASLQEEAEAIGWYEQRMSIEKNDEVRRIMEHAHTGFRGVPRRGCGCRS